MQPIPFAITSDEAQSLPWSRQRLVNVFAQPANAPARTALVLRSCPGLKEFADTGAYDIRGMLTTNGACYVVAGTSMYELDANGKLTKQTGSVGGAGPVFMDSNTDQVLALNGDGEAFVLSSGTVEKITDADYQLASCITTMDGYGIFTVKGTGQFFITDLNDFTSVDALDFATAEKRPDDLVGCIADHDELWLFGLNTVEVWRNTGAAAFPFERLPGGVLEVGCASALSIAKADNSVFWLGNDRRVYRAEGYTPVGRSTPSLEDKLAEYSDAAIAEAQGFTFTQQGRKFYVLCVEGAEAAHVLDLSTNLWHDRETWRLGAPALWRASCAVEAFGKVLVGDRYSGKIFELDPKTYQDDGGILRRQVTAAPLNAQRNPIFGHRLQLDAEVGVGLNTGQGSDPQIMLDHTDDGRTWSSERWKTLGAIGEYRTRVIWNRLGRFFDRTYRLTVTDPVPVSFYALSGEWTMGR